MNSDFMKRLTVYAISAGLILLCHSCGETQIPEEPDIVPVIKNAVIDPAVTYQEMIGFGGSLTWYSKGSLQARRRNRYANFSSRISEQI